MLAHQAPINIHEAKTHLSRLVDQAAMGQSFIIAKAGKPMVQVVPIAPTLKPKKKRMGFMPKQSIPQDFDRMGESDFEAIFHRSAHATTS